MADELKAIRGRLNITLDAAQAFRQALLHRNSPPPHNVHPTIWAAQFDSMAVMVVELEREAAGLRAEVIAHDAARGRIAEGE